MEVRISVRNLVEFILRSGDLDNRKAASPENAMQEGGRIHRMIQRRMGSNYFAEVLLRERYETEQYSILIEGRADGIIANGEPEGVLATEEAALTAFPISENLIMIDEIKGTYRDLDKILKPVPTHLAQAKCYAYIYAKQNSLDAIRVRMTYCHIETEEIKYFYEEYTFLELELWFQAIMAQYKKWADFTFSWQERRQASIKTLEFPFPYREGQGDLVKYVYHTIYHKRKLFLEAPTGVGKTISTVFPTVKAMGEGMVEKIFYLTAKTITRTVADGTFAILREKGLSLKTVVLTAKDKICPLEEPNCNPDSCPYAKGHYDRINEAVYDLLMHEDNFGREAVTEYAEKHKVCPFEMCLDMSLFADAVICDYNYVFDPHVYLRRFFAEGVRGQYIFLIDEAHNLVDRGREMYSASLVKEDFLALKKSIRKALEEGSSVKHKGALARIEKQLEKSNREMLSLKRECPEQKVLEDISQLVLSLNRLYSGISDYLEDHDDSQIRKNVLEFFFVLSHFLFIYEKVDENYIIYEQLESGGQFLVKLFNVNPSKNLQACMMRGRSSILFSATLLPIQYYKRLLGGSAEDYEVYAESNFDARKQALFIGSDVTSKYSRRSDMEYYNIAAYIYEIVKNRHGNYMVFFPSHAFLAQVYEIFRQRFLEEDSMECIIQADYMSEEDREAFLQHFVGNEDCDLTALIAMDITMEEEKSLIGFCVMGGIFSEGIDLKNDSLIGVVIVGTGLPQVCYERELLKQYFDAGGDNGFDYAYRYPGMNKVLQAAGRVIRTTEDIGIVALLDERFLEWSYRRLFPKEWNHCEIVTGSRIAGRIERFWDEWL